MSADPEIIQMTPNDFDRLAIAIMRAHCMVERVRENQATGMESAAEIEQEAAACAYRLREVFAATDERPDREKRAKALGWPTSDALMAFLFDGASFGTVQ